MHRSRPLAALALVLLAACPGGDDGPTTPPPTPTVGVTLAASAVALTTGGSPAQIGITVSRGGNYAGAVDLSLDGAPAGVTGSFSPASVANGTTTSTLTLSAAASAAAGTANVTVRAKGTGAADQTAPLTLTLTAPPPTPAFTMTLAAGTLSVQQGASGVVRVGFVRSGGFAAGVAVTVDGLPAGVTATAAPASATGDSSVVTLAVAATATPGTYPLTVRGAATGLTDRTAPLSLIVTAAPVAGSYTLALSPASVTLPPGGSATSTINVARTNGFAGAVGLAVTGAPTGLTATLASASTTAGSVGVTVAATAAVAPGAYTLTVRGTAAGIADQTATLTVTVAVAGSFTIAVTPSTVSLTRGGTATATVDIARAGGFTGGVDVTVSGLPTGVTATIAPVAGSIVSASRSPRAGSAQRIGIGGIGGIGGIAARDVIPTGKAAITLTAGAAAPTGPFTLTVTATAAGLPPQTASAGVTVAAGPTPGTGAIAWQFCDAANLPIWFAYQDGTGAWTRVVGASNLYRFDVAAGRGGVAFVTRSGTGYNTLVYYGTAAELTSYGTSQCVGGTTAFKSVTGSVSGVAGTDMAYVGTTGRMKGLSQQTGGFSFTLDSVPDGARDYFASKVATSFGATGLTMSLSKLILRRGLNPAAGSALAPFDFASSEAFDPASRTLTIGNTNGDLAAISMQYLTGAASTTSAAVLLYTETVLGGASSRTIYTVPAAQQRAGDVHAVSVVATPASANTTNIPVRSVTKFFAASADQSVTLGPALTIPTVSSLTATRYRVQVAKQAEYDKYFSASWFQTGAGGRSVTVGATAAYVGGGAWDVAIPDLSSAAYDATWGLLAGAANTTFSATGWDFNANAPNGVVDGGTVRTGVRSTVVLGSVRAVRAPRSLLVLPPGVGAVVSRSR